MMSLVVDEGNTLCKFAVVNRNEVVAEDSIADFDMGYVERFAEPYHIEAVIVASTRGNAEGISEALRSKFERVLCFTSQTEIPIQVEYSSRDTLGADRIAVAVGVLCGMGIEDALIVDMGSAITFDIVEGGVFRGGNISLGVAMRFQALHDYTATLPHCTADGVVEGFGSSTSGAIERGVMQGVLFEIEGYVERVSRKNGKKSIIFCGGDAKYFVNRIKNAIFAGRKLMFTGLNEILEYNVCKGNI